MRDVPELKSPIAGRRLWFEPAEIEAMAQEELSAANMLSGAMSIDIEAFVEFHLGIEVEYANLNDGIMGSAQFRSGQKARIQISSNLVANEKSTTFRRLRSTLAHECGHVLLHGPVFERSFAPSSQTDLFTSQSVSLISPEPILCREPPSSSPVRAGGPWWEVQANMMMVALLLPHNRFFELAGEIARTEVIELSNPNLSQAQQKRLVANLSDAFNVSREMVGYRLESVVLSRCRQQPLSLEEGS